jgi:hypothetical protein
MLANTNAVFLLSGRVWAGIDVPDGVIEIVVWFVSFAVGTTLIALLRCGVFLPLVLLRMLVQRYTGRVNWEGRQLIKLELGGLQNPPASSVNKNRISLCLNCRYVQLVRGYLAGEESITCGYAFPPHAMPFVVRECSDFKPKRERIDVEIAIEGAVSSPPLEEMAADFRVAAAVSPSARE